MTPKQAISYVVAKCDADGVEPHESEIKAEVEQLLKEYPEYGGCVPGDFYNVVPATEIEICKTASGSVVLLI